MNIARNDIISTSCTEYFDFEVPHGSMNTIFLPGARFYVIDNIDVEQPHRRQGIGKMMLRGALEHATEIHADLIISAVVSRECLQAMRGVFGPEALEIEKEGIFGMNEDYDNYMKTSAALHYHLS
jgi:GNAT superfamily N-acetyltransferase